MKTGWNIRAELFVESERRCLVDRQPCFAEHGYQEEPQLFLRKMFHDGEKRVL
jgi:hypothetical protein